MSAKRNALNKDAKKETARPHQPGQSVFKAILPEEIDWKPFPAFPPSARLAIVAGEPLQEGPYTIRVKVPHDVKLMPYRHPEDRIYTGISGIFYIGLGDRFNAKKLMAYPPGAVIICPAIHPTSIGRSPESTSRRRRRLVRSDLNTLTSRMTRGTKAPRYNQSLDPVGSASGATWGEGRTRRRRED